jgi:hypothetical protein
MRTKEIYGNCKVNHPDGSLMFLCLPKRANWYLSRDLAVVTCEDPYTIQLTFIPNGKGAMDDKYSDEERSYLLGEKKNVCVVCGSDKFELLTKHHIVPHEYRKHFPISVKSRSSHDIVPICVKHHMKYEHAFADRLKRDLEKRFEIESANIERSKMSRMAKAHSFAKILMNPDRIMRIPDDRIEFFEKEIKEVFEEMTLQEIVELDIQKIAKEKTDAVSKLVTEKLEEYMTLDEFIIMWRKHFIDSMNPLHMPEGWNIMYNIK